MDKTEILARIDRVAHTDRTWRRIRRDVERGQIDESEARRYLTLHRDRLAGGDQRSAPFVPLWEGIVALAGDAERLAGDAEREAARPRAAEPTGKALGDQALRDAVEHRAIDALGTPDAGRWEQVVQRLSGTGGITDHDLATWRGRERGGADFDLLGRVVAALGAAHRARTVDRDDVLAEVRAHIAGGVKGRWADVLRRLEGDPGAIGDHDITHWFRYGRRGAARPAVEGTLPKVRIALQQMREDERDAYAPVVYSGASMPVDFWGNETNRRVNADGYVLQLPPDGWEYEVMGQRPARSDGGLKLLSPWGYARPLPAPSCRVYGVPPGSLRRTRVRWRRDRRSDWLQVDAPGRCALSDRIHAWGMDFSGNFGGVALPDPVAWPG